MKAQYVWTVEELIAARRQHWRHSVRRGFRVAGYFVLTLTFFAGVTALIKDREWFPGTALIAVVIYIVFLHSIEQRWSARRHFRSRPDRDATVTTEFEDQMIRASTTVGDRGESPWTTFHKAVVGETGVLLYYNPQLFQWYPKHAFSSTDEYEQFVKLARSKIPKHYKV